MRTPRLALVFAVTLTLLAAPGATRGQGEEKEPTAQEAALEVVQAYVETLKAKNAEAGLEEHWSFEALCQGIFQSHFTKMSKKDQAETAATFREILLPTMTDPQVADLMASSSYEDFEAERPKKGLVQVGLTVTFSLEGAEPTRQYYWVKKVGGAYRIVDMANGAPEQALTKTLGGQYRQHAETVTPLDYVRMMKEG